VSARDCSTALRRFTGPEADELAVLVRPEAPQGAAEQAVAAYETLAETLAAVGGAPADVVAEALLLRDVRRELPDVLAARERVLGALGEARRAPFPSVIGQPPVVAHAAFELVASAVVPRDRRAWSVRDVPAELACACAGCRRSGARLVRLGNRESLHTASLYGPGGGVYEQATAMFRAAERLLERCGMGFRDDVVRTWIHLRDIDRDYDALNRARREFFERSGVAVRPASTGVGGGPWPEAHDCCLSFQAVKSPRLEVSGMSTPLLNEAWSYGADFSRGLRVVDANKVALHVSGTASIDEAGRTAHVGGFAAQAERMIDNVASLLAGQGAGLGDVVSGITYLRDAGDAPVLREVARRRGFLGFPCAVVQAALCRPELLCETEVVALLPRSAAGA
jgi:enamine deaminase RidA (YjgF/YER057c/UK114 family)